MSIEEHARSDEDLVRRAHRRVALKMGFLTHALVFVLVNGAMIAFTLVRGGPLWSFWPLFGWGIGLAAHGAATWFSLNGDGLRERMLKQEIERLRRDRQGERASGSAFRAAASGAPGRRRRGVRAALAG